MVFNFLALPKEIRLEIYTQLLFLHPVSYKEWGAPGSQAPKPSTCLFEPMPDEHGNIPAGVKLLSPYRPHGYIPTALLQANRQVYEECRMVPFRENEFVFVRYFRSGVDLALEFVNKVAKSELEEVRYLRMYVFQEGRIMDIGVVNRYSDDRTIEREWEELCERFGVGVRGLRLKMFPYPFVKSGVMRRMRDWWGDVLEGYAPESDFESRYERTVFEHEVEEWRWRWVDRGLRKMGGLRQVEVEVKDREGDFREDGVVEWIRRFDRRLNEGREEGHKVRVICVKESEESPEKKDWEEWVRGQLRRQVPD
ncbi:hypothetical protein QBC40DRAFT_286524 [Triangularia verruculosa]|uniref:Uncharacterized protein n=1 Tax=Triangularia verruculosa TaxID=2587418 RepID=A0AAN6XA47_9PEZI|nr:hypothetical protein QBC40DRAFT_286524 [Triangularia verruculosa]